MSIRRLLSILMALTTIVLGLVGAYSYGQAYSQHRGFATVLKIKRAGTGQLLNVNFYSPGLHRKAYYLIYLPPGYKPSNRYPVLYLLHGMPGKPEVFINIANLDVRLDNELAQGNLRPMIMVFPDGRIGGSTYSDSEWANTPAGGFESYVIEVVKNVDSRFSTLPHRQDRAIGGFSAGAYGAMNIALHHLRVFGSIEAWSAYFSQSRTGVFAHAGNATLTDNSPIDYVSRLKPALASNPLRVFMFVGRDDQASKQIIPMARALTSAGGHATYAIYRGGHDWDVWYPRLNQMLILASHDFSTPLPAPRSTPKQRSGALVPGAAVDRLHHDRHSGGSRHRSHRGARRRPADHHRVQGRRALTIAPTDRRRPIAHAGAAQDHLKLIGALLLALASAAAINIGFLLQHRGLAEQTEGGSKALLAMFSNRSWLVGQAVGWTGFAAQLVAVALAPLSLVQAFAAGGLAISLPFAARLFGQRVSRSQLLAISLIALSLASLPIGLVAHSHLHGAALLRLSLIGLAIAGAIGVAGGPAAQAIAAGCFYAVADAAIKAVSAGWHAHAAAALVSGWTVLAVVATFGGFLTFQASLRRGSAVAAISLMNVFAALGALACGILTFGETLGSTPGATIVHLLAISLVLTCVPVLASGQQRIAGSGQIAEPHAGGRRQAAPHLAGVLMMLAGGVAALVLVVLSALAGVGLLYGMRGLGWLGVGPPIGDSLPLLQLAHFDGQPLPRVALASLASGLAFGAVATRIDPRRRAIVALVPGVLLLLFASDASFALAHNLRLAGVLWHRSPGSGPWLEGLLFAAGAVIPGSVLWRRPKARPRRVRDLLSDTVAARMG